MLSDLRLESDNGICACGVKSNLHNRDAKRDRTDDQEAEVIGALWEKVRHKKAMAAKLDGPFEASPELPVNQTSIFEPLRD